LKKLLCSGLIFFLCLSQANAQEMKTVELEISGPMLRASAIALEEFSKRPCILDNYRVVVRKKYDSYEVTFAPRPPLGEEMWRGGGNSNGDEVKYLVSKRGGIERISYAR
jgi:hypothetical protein